jgi:hypothetical protein
VSLAELYLADNPSLAGSTQFPVAPLSYIGAKGFVKFIADADQGQGRHHVNFNLDAEGEMLRIASPALGVIDTVSFGAQALGVSQGRLPDGTDNIADFAEVTTPAESNYRPLAQAIINEVLTHTDSPLEDAIEIYNPSGQGIDSSGWFLSDSASDLKKYRIPDGTFLPAGGYRVFYEVQFNSGGPGSFTLDGAGGDQVHLSEADAAGNLSGRRAVARFGAAANGVSFGRYDTCNGADFVPLSQRTFGQDSPASLAQFRTGAGLFNAYPKVGPVVINELMYHPPSTTNTDNTLDEYVELHNFSASPVTLYDPAHPVNTWRLRNGVTFVFPQGVTLPAGGYLLVAGFDPAANPAQMAAFRARYGIATSVPVFGPYIGKLDNGGESVELYRPDTPQAGTGFVPYLLADRVEYGNSAPWPAGSDGDGASLQRGAVSEHGIDAANWNAAGPTAGRANVTPPARSPSIVAQPVSRSVGTGSRVIFSVSVCGSSPLSYQWRFNGANIAGATGPAHIIASAQAGDAGGYTVLVSNGAGSMLSKLATFTLMDPPVITAQPQSQTIAGGLSATFNVGASPDLSGFSYQWRRNGIDLPDATNATLTLNGLGRNDAADYSVLVMNPAGAVASAVARLTVLMPPTITLQPQSQVVNTNTTVTFTIAANGTGPVRYQWQFNGVNIPGATNATLLINDVQLANEGDYRVVLTDNIASGLSAVARLTVRVRPVVLAAPIGQTNAVGSTVTLSVTASGSVPMGFSWRIGSLVLTNMVLMTTNSIFTIFNAQTNDSATYRCIITNAGNASGVLVQATVLILAAPVLQDVEWLGNGSVRLKLSGVPDRNHAIEISSNLTNWTTLNTIFYTNSLMPFEDATVGGTTHRFYRARLLP